MPNGAVLFKNSATDLPKYCGQGNLGLLYFIIFSCILTQITHFGITSHN